jgi:hypothetical protein
VSTRVFNMWRPATMHAGEIRVNRFTTAFCSKRRGSRSHHHCCHNEGYRQNQKYALHYFFTSFPFFSAFPKQNRPPQVPQST